MGVSYPEIVIHRRDCRSSGAPLARQLCQQGRAVGIIRVKFKRAPSRGYCRDVIAKMLLRYREVLESLGSIATQAGCGRVGLERAGPVRVWRWVAAAVQIKREIARLRSVGSVEWCQRHCLSNQRAGLS